MWAIVKRASVPMVLLLGGVGSLIYGARYHSVTVVEEHEETITIPHPLGPPPFMEESLPPGVEPPPFIMEPPPFLEGPPPIVEKITTEVPKDEREPTLIREITFGGVTLLASGVLKRTYSGEPPSLCPT